MRLEGRRFHVAGSASRQASPEMLRYGHELIGELVGALLYAGGSLVVGVGKGPLLVDSDPSSPSIIFDWTVLERVWAHLRQGGAAAGLQRPVVATVASSKTEDQIPVSRMAMWRDLRRAGAVRLEHLSTGWTSGAERRSRQAQWGDVLIALSGGQGVEQLAEVYAQAGKPIISFDLQLGASS